MVDVTGGRVGGCDRRSQLTGTRHNAAALARMAKTATNVALMLRVRRGDIACQGRIVENTCVRPCLSIDSTL